MISNNTRFFINNIFIGNTKLKSAKKQAKAKQYPGPELLLYENYSISLSTLSSKNNKTYSKEYAKKNFVYFNEIIWLIIMKRKLVMNNRSYRSDIFATIIKFMIFWEFLMVEHIFFSLQMKRSVISTKKHFKCRKTLLHNNILMIRSTINFLPLAFTHFITCLRNKKNVIMILKKAAFLCRMISTYW